MKYGRATTDLHAKSNMHHQTNIAIQTNVCTSYSGTEAKQKYNFTQGRTTSTTMCHGLQTCICQMTFKPVERFKQRLRM